MFRRLIKKRAQSTLEYAILIGVIVAGLIVMQVYLKRGYQGKIREGADDMGEQFSPYETSYNYTTNSFTDSTENLSKTGESITNIHNQTTNRFGNESVLNLDQETWW